MDVIKHKPSGLNITAVSRLKHAELHLLVKKFGSQQRLASHLGVSITTLGKWVYLLSCPPLQSNRHYSEQELYDLELKLFALTGKSLEQLFPETLQSAAQFREASKVVEQTRYVEPAMLQKFAESIVYSVQDAEAQSRSNHAIDVMKQKMSKLSYREREILKMRFGFGGVDSHCYTLREVALAFKIGKERVRQIEARSLKKLQGWMDEDLKIGDSEMIEQIMGE